MSAELERSQRPALVEFPNEVHEAEFVETVPFELNRETISYPLDLDASDDDKLFVSLKWPEPIAVRELVKQQKITWTVEGEEVNWDPGDTRPAHEFLLAHVTGGKLGDEEIPGEKMREFIKKYHHKGWAEQIILRQLMAVARPPTKRKASSIDTLFDDSVAIRVVDCVDGKLFATTLTHHLKTPTMDQVRTAREAMQFGMRKAKHHHKINPALLTEVYHGRILSIDNAVIDGQPCTEANRAQWNGDSPGDCKVPFQWIHAVLNADKQGVSARSPL